MADYIIAGNAAVDKITFADGTSTGFMPGGATLFALTGIQLWTDNIMMCGGFGKDYMEHMGDWINRNRIDTSGFHVRDDKNPVNYLIYKDDGDWYSYTEYGNDHYDNLVCDPLKDGMRKFLPGTKGVYCFREDDMYFFGQMAQLRDLHGFRLMWEIKATTAIPGKLPVIRQILEHVDAFSINQQEAFQLFGVSDDRTAIEALQALGIGLVVYRVGAKGIYILLDQQDIFAPAVTKFTLKDVTGCGNSSTAAAFYAWCESKDIFEIAAMANVTAAINLQYQGVMELTEENRLSANLEAKQLADYLRNNNLEVER